jgi:predicted ATPase/DNA-binding CsgD family transcriptional regulator
MPETPELPRKDAADEPGELVAFPGAREQARPQNNLPMSLSSLVGREKERIEAGQLLAERRLLTLTGPGGSGKTRLALAVAGDVAGEFEDGVWWVELAPISDPELVAQEVARVLMIKERPGRSMTETLARNLAAAELLLIVDNCEHLVEACERLVSALLYSCPKVRILATSRESLGVAGETVLLVPPLSLPDAGHLPAPIELGRYEAVRLFVERARSATPTFDLTERNARAVALLCSNLDGIPLAIELAAARTRVLSVAQISSRLASDLRVLKSASRTADPRQQTLAATLEWSHELLEEPERTLFRRLSVFAGGFSLEAAEGICTGGGIQEDDVLDLLSRLVDKSLVSVAVHDGVEARYRLLETIRQYSSEKLLEAEETDEVVAGHALFFLLLAEEVEPGITSADRPRWLKKLEKDHDNLRAALARSFDARAQAETGERLAGALLWFWFHHDYVSEGRRWLHKASSTGGTTEERPASRAARAKALCGAGLLDWIQGDQTAARTRLEESVALWRGVEDEQGLGQALRILAHVMLGQGDPSVARHLGEESVRLFRHSYDAFGLSTSLATLGMVAMTQEDYAAARSLLEESVEICRDSRDYWALSLALRNQGIMALKQGDYERAATRLAESELALEEPRSAFGMLNLDLLATAISMRGDHERAARLFGAAEAAREAAGVSVLPSTRADYDRGVAAARTGLGEAAFDPAWAEGKAMPPKLAVELALNQPPLPEDDAPPSYPAGLSAREVDVLKLVAQGLTNAQIARDLFISPNTVNRHLNSIYHKIDVSSRAAATRFASEHRLA